MEALDLFPFDPADLDFQQRMNVLSIEEGGSGIKRPSQKRSVRP